jgi:hypothetical protein
VLVWVVPSSVHDAAIEALGPSTGAAAENENVLGMLEMESDGEYEIKAGVWLHVLDCAVAAAAHLAVVVARLPRDPTVTTLSLNKTTGGDAVGESVVGASVVGARDGAPVVGALVSARSMHAHTMGETTSHVAEMSPDHILTLLFTSANLEL